MKFKQKSDGTYIVKFEKRIAGMEKRWSAYASNIKTKEQAMREYKKMIAAAAVAEQKFRGQISEMKMEEAVDNFKRDCSDRYSPKTMESMYTTLHKYVISDFAGRDVASLTPSDFKSLMKGSAANVSDHHKKNIAKYFRALFKYLLFEQKVTTNPVPEFRHKAITKLDHVFKEEEINKLLSTALLTNSPWYEIWAFAIYTGMRNGELFALTWDQINEESRTIRVTRNWDSKGLFREYTKTKSQRIVEYPEKLIPVIARLKAMDHDPDFVLPRVRGWAKGAQAEHLAAFLAGAGLPRIRFHDLRATWCTYLLSRNVAPALVMSMGGWTSLKTVMHYLRSSGVEIKGASSPFDSE